jgi:hypothetical protein
MTLTQMQALAEAAERYIYAYNEYRCAMKSDRPDDCDRYEEAMGAVRELREVLEWKGDCDAMGSTDSRNPR